MKLTKKERKTIIDALDWYDNSCLSEMSDKLFILELTRKIEKNKKYNKINKSL